MMMEDFEKIRSGNTDPSKAFDLIATALTEFNGRLAVLENRISALEKKGSN